MFFCSPVDPFWKARNDFIFNNIASKDVKELSDLVRTRIGFWIKGKFDIKDYSIEDFKRSLDEIRRIKI
ncbi:hypothetical protein RHMOL_Rhmol08G0210300 [Rhododendron molle]|uniref:Uncharacterized protein n=1 Tax=Rhododendron molle TaxID=49168 RepID=A0ACC0MS15_RHOML|nr:hypothetical protein RHMOL_Rhmol08G0210300 [Rhododendron molle]